MAKLYIVGTPIGNLGDFSVRGQQTLKEVDFIAAEDTRVSRGLLTHFGISAPLISYHQHNSRERGAEIINRIQNGESCAVITDAGMPAISDPGEDIVRLCHENKIAMEVIPGPTAVASAVAMSGIPSRKFMFEGFLEGKPSAKQQQLEELKDNTRTIVYYESPHHLKATLKLMYEVFGNRQIALCREITKLHEETLRFALEEAVEYYKENDPRGEYVIVVEGAQKMEEEKMPFEKAAQIVKQRAAQGTGLSQAAKEVAVLTGYKKGDLYKQALEDN